MVAGHSASKARGKGSVCPVCGSENVQHCLTVPSVPVFCNISCDSIRHARQVPRADMCMGFCARCGHMYNYAFQPDLLDYRARYENSLHCSQRFRAFSAELAAHLVDTYDLHDKLIVEIGCGDGYFLNELCCRGANRGVGFEPSAAALRSPYEKDGKLHIVNDFFDERHTELFADFVCCRHVLEHLHSPRHVLAAVHRILSRRPGCIAFFEVPNSRYTLRDMGVWDLLYEHFSYFSQESLAYLFESSGFEVLDVESGFGEQFLGIAARVPNAAPGRCALHATSLAELHDLVETFGSHYRRKKKYWIYQLDRLRRKGRRVVVWGAGTKGTMFCNTVDINGAVSHVVDINPRKHGTYIAGSGQPVVPPGFVARYRPDYIFVMNPIYLDEIAAEMNAMGVFPTVLTA